MAYGTTYKANRLAILQGSPLCHWCGRNTATQADHLVELDAGGSDSIDNLVASCGPCNSRRGQKYRANKDARRIAARNALPVLLHSKMPTPTPISVLYPKDLPGLAPISHDRPRLATTVPDGVESFGPAVADWSEQHLEVTLMPWQRFTLDGQLAHVDGELVHRSALTTTARQNGKTSCLKPLIGWWLTAMPVIRGQKQTVVSTAHSLTLASLLFQDLAPLLEEEFGAKLGHSFGRQQATMPDGTRWFVRAASPSVGHGLSVDLAVADELWDIGRAAIDTGLVPSMRARKSPLLSMWSTAGTESSESLINWREQGLRAIETNATSSLFFAEWSAPSSLDAMTPEAWAYSNPALGHTLELATLAAESENPDRASFLRSNNTWVSALKSWLPPGRWAALETDTMPEGGVLAIETSVDDTIYYGLRAALNDDKRAVVEVTFAVNTWQAAVDQAVELGAQYPLMQFAVSPSVEPHWPLELDRRTTIVGYKELLRFTPLVHHMILERRLLHMKNDQLDEQIGRAVAVKTQASMALSSQKSAGPIELARMVVWAAALVAKPTVVGRPTIGVST
ncbi:HNHc domain containing protein [uncultured Caudovirales phage]|uniref:HNHc domain containing protein n=1 Tax=uncultured Caudovirales phage TaxID=2100421 RepID=A0A6J5QY84_9CAUD|nr:HNHc domain containing protein [uncultured Caudovirales phage]CAB4189610.1 HNHc domain containing protein [uncultured Caudovirales phage]CAB4194126.1 HNHc domain containing protein [uncultured Caudovirales phage]